MTDSVELLRWLADDHFTFLGYREYQLVTAPAATTGDAGQNGAGQYGAGQYGAATLQAVLGTGLGILRRDPPEPGRCRQ